MVQVCIGWDAREVAAYRVCKHSIVARSKGGVAVEPLIEPMLRIGGLYRRAVSVLEDGRRYDHVSGAWAATDFAFTRFLVPFLAAHTRRKFVLFCDCDFVFTRPIEDLFRYADERFAVQVVKHDFALAEGDKMDGQAQQAYPRKWWSALVLWNLDHPANRRLTLADVNEQPGAWLHRFGWLADEEIGDLPADWHWLEGYSAPFDPAAGITPSGIHYTHGGPWLGERWRHVAYADLWLDELAAAEAAADVSRRSSVGA